MEGVVLYLKLVVVFITRHKRCYIAFFTIASFGATIDESEFCVIVLVYINIM